jgi:hypothetical protein
VEIYGKWRCMGSGDKWRYMGSGDIREVEIYRKWRYIGSGDTWEVEIYQFQYANNISLKK